MRNTGSAQAYGDTPESDLYLSRYPHLAETLRGFFGGPHGQDPPR